MSEATLSQHLAQLGIRSSTNELLDAIAQKGPSLCLIDGADCLLLSERRSIVVDLFGAICSCKTREQWRIVTSARSLQGRDLVGNVLEELGTDHVGVVIQVGELEDGDLKALGTAFPSFRPLFARDDLAGQNRSLFLLRELLTRPAPPTGAFTEVDIADAWATGHLSEPERIAHRSTARRRLGICLSLRHGGSPGAHSSIQLASKHCSWKEQYCRYPTAM